MKNDCFRQASRIYHVTVDSHVAVHGRLCHFGRLLCLESTFSPIDLASLEVTVCQVDLSDLFSVFTADSLHFRGFWLWDSSPLRVWNGPPTTRGTTGLTIDLLKGDIGAAAVVYRGLRVTTVGCELRHLSRFGMVHLRLEARQDSRLTYLRGTLSGGSLWSIADTSNNRTTSNRSIVFMQNCLG